MLVIRLTRHIPPPVGRRSLETFQHHCPSRSVFRALHRKLIFRPRGFLRPFFYITLLYVGSKSSKQALVGRFPNAQANRIRIGTLGTFILCTFAYGIIMFSVTVTACS
jgi:hypothetical protein